MKILHLLPIFRTAQPRVRERSGHNFMHIPVIETNPKKPFTAKRNIFLNHATGEYCIRVGRGEKRARWVSLGTNDRLEAMRRLERTGVGEVIEIAGDARFRESVVSAITSAGRVRLDRVVEEWLADMATRVSKMSMIHPQTISKQLLSIFPPSIGVDEVTVQRVNAWISTAPSLTRRRRRMSVLTSLFEFAFHQGYRKDNIGPRLGMRQDDLTFDQMEREVKEPFTQAEYDAMLACPAITGFWRNAIQLSWWLGLRISDCCKLQWGSFCAVPGKLAVWQAKTRRRVEFDLSDPLLGGGTVSAIVQDMLKNVEDAVYCFPDMRDAYDNDRQRLVDQFRAHCISAGLDGTKTFRCLRKSAAIRWKNAGRSLDEIGELLGHTGASNAEFYVETKH